MSTPAKAVAIVSGGMDSVVAASVALAKGYQLHILSFDYGQRHYREIACAKHFAHKINAPHDVIDLTSVTHLLKGSSLSDANIDVPEGHYASENMKLTVVPNRNMMMLSVAIAVAVAENAEVIVAGFHSGDHFIYPDCRPEFVDAMNHAIKVANEGFGDPDLHVWAPFINSTKADIVKIGRDLGVDWVTTWSCYRGGQRHCGSCGTCVERAEAFHLAGVPDPTEYDQPDYWKTAEKATV